LFRASRIGRLGRVGGSNALKMLRCCAQGRHYKANLRRGCYPLVFGNGPVAVMLAVRAANLLMTKHGWAALFTDRPPGKHPWSALQPVSPDPPHRPQAISIACAVTRRKKSSARASNRPTSARDGECPVQRLKAWGTRSISRNREATRSEISKGQAHSDIEAQASAAIARQPRRTPSPHWRACARACGR
jgi:hypothetical protein